MRVAHNKIITPPKKEFVRSWLEEKYTNFEPNFLDELIDRFFKTIDTHTEYSKKKSIKYIQDNLLKWSRIYRKQELSYWTNRGWSEDKSNDKRVVRNKDWYIKEYGEEGGLKLYNERCKNISKNCGHSLEKYISRYGEEEGKLKWDKYKINYMNSIASKESLLVFDVITDWLISLGLDKNDIYVGKRGSKEYFLNNNGSFYLYDFTIRSERLIIEYNGVNWHANPNWSNEVLVEWKHPFSDETYEENINNYNKKIDTACNNGFKVLTLWSDVSLEENLKISKDFIIKNIKILC